MSQMSEKTTYAGLRTKEWVGLLIVVPALLALIFLSKPYVSDILDRILHLNPTMVYIVVFALVFAEAAIFFGFIFPGETAVILGGVVASGGHVNIVLLAALVVIAAITGDSVGYFVGERYGERILSIKLLAHRRGGIDAGLVLLRKRGALAVFIGRFTAFLRAVMPGLAGLSKMHYRTFLKANAAGGLVWGVGFTMIGYLLGGAYKKAEKYAGWASTSILIIIVILAAGLFIRSKIKERKIEASFESSGESGAERISEEIAAAQKAIEDKQNERD